MPAVGRLVGLEESRSGSGEVAPGRQRIHHCHGWARGTSDWKEGTIVLASSCGSRAGRLDMESLVVLTARVVYLLYEALEQRIDEEPI